MQLMTVRPLVSAGHAEQAVYVGSPVERPADRDAPADKDAGNRKRKGVKDDIGRVQKDNVGELFEHMFSEHACYLTFGEFPSILSPRL